MCLNKSINRNLGYVLGGVATGVSAATAGCGYMVYGEKVTISNLVGDIGPVMLFLACEASFGTIAGVVGAVGGAVLAGATAHTDTHIE